MSAYNFVKMLNRGGCIGTVSAPQASEITADPAALRHVMLPSFQDGARRAFYESAMSRAAEYLATKGQAFSEQPALDLTAFLDC
eukprot:6200003-Prymnesium_polylepis.1